jgi:hypothetical protein
VLLSDEHYAPEQTQGWEEEKKKREAERSQGQPRPGRCDLTRLTYLADALAVLVYPEVLEKWADSKHATAVFVDALVNKFVETYEWLWSQLMYVVGMKTTPSLGTISQAVSMS